MTLVYNSEQFLESLFLIHTFVFAVPKGASEYLNLKPLGK